MIQVHVFRKGEELNDVPVADLSQVRTEPQTLVWVDLVSPTPDELAAMGEEFQVHELALASCATGPKQRPRVEEYEGQVLLIAYAAKPVGAGQAVDLHELDLIAGRNYLLTFHGGAPIDAAEVARRVAARPQLAKHGSGFLLYVALDEVVDTFFPALDQIGERIEELEEAVFESTVDVQSQIFSLRRDLIAIRRVAGPMRDAMIVLLRATWACSPGSPSATCRTSTTTWSGSWRASRTTRIWPRGRWRPAWPSSPTGSGWSPATSAPTPPSSPWSP